MSLPDPRAHYALDARLRADEMSRLRKGGRVYIAAKLAAFVLGLLGFSRYLAPRPGLAAALLAGFAAVFSAAAILHERIIRRTAAEKRLLQVDEEEQRALDGEFLPFGSAGEELADPVHPYSSDLDLFGLHSLFHFLGRTATGPGRRTLAQALLRPSTGPEIREAQIAVRELAGKPDFRRRIRAAALQAGSGGSPGDSYVPPAEQKEFLLGKPLLPLFLVLLPAGTLAALAGVAWGLPIAPFAVLVLVQLVINKITAGRVEALCGDAARHHRALSVYAEIIAAIEKETFEAPRLRRLRDRFFDGGLPASKSVRRLSSLLGWMNARSGGVWHALLNIMILWDLQGAYRLERWNRQWAEKIPLWLEALGDVESLAALANCSFNHPAWIFPEIRLDGFALKGTALGHPLIPEAERVVNDYALTGPGAVDVLTGPNMAGKSTFLRTIGVNAVLAFAGGPVCAAALEISPFGLITSMKSSDSLDKRMSLFYAELVRLKMILEEIRDGRPAFFLIDEMLRGTNAQDRHKGSLALMRQLLKAGATGIVATHDLDLTALAAENPRVVNHHFDSRVEGDNLAFDFKIKPGVCTSFNALVLMKKMGLDV
jgi:hypothetical protein